MQSSPSSRSTAAADKANPLSESIGTCDNCGLCCQHLLVEANALDVLREPRIESEHPFGHRSAQLSVLEACWIIAGPGRPCPFLTPEKHCGIYPTRPNGCVAFVAGSRKCQQLRKDHGNTPVVPQPSVHIILNEIALATIAEEADEPDGIL